MSLLYPLRIFSIGSRKTSGRSRCVTIIGAPPPLEHRLQHPAVDLERHTRDVRGTVRREEHRGRSELLRLAVAAERDHARRLPILLDLLDGFAGALRRV